MKKILILSLFLSGCNSLGVASHAVSTADSLGLNFDTNGYYSKRTKPAQKICEYKTGTNSTAWKPC